MGVYVENWSMADADETHGDSPAPFGDHTWRVIDDEVGGVIAYFNNETDANHFVSAESTNPNR